MHNEGVLCIVQGKLNYESGLGECLNKYAKHVSHMFVRVYQSVEHENLRNKKSPGNAEKREVEAEKKRYVRVSQLPRYKLKQHQFVIPMLQLDWRLFAHS